MQKSSKIVLLLCAFCFGIGSANGLDNVILISIDSLRIDYLSCYGSKKLTTPNIDSLAAGGVLFKNAVSTTPLTLPAHASLFTGLIPPVHGVQDNTGFTLDSKYSTLAEVFTRNRYTTAAFVASFPLDSRFGLDQGFQYYDDNYHPVDYLADLTQPERNAETVTNAALQWLQSRGKDPWFLFLHYNDPNFPYEAPYEFSGRYPSDPYAGEVAYVDDQIGRLLAYLKQNKLDTSTLIVLTADHGEALNEHNERTHGTLAYESTMKIPLILAPFPKRIIKQRVRLIDIAPTIADIQKLSLPKRIQGTSLIPLLNGKGELKTVSYFETLWAHLNANAAPLRGFYSEQYKYIQLPVPELYDLNKDPREEDNLCETDERLCVKYSSLFTRVQSFYRGVTGKGNTRQIKNSEAENPKDLIALRNRMSDAILLTAEKDYEGSLKIVQEILSQRPVFIPAYISGAYLQYMNGRPEAAAQMLKKLGDLGFTNHEVQGRLGFFLYQAKNYEESIDQLTAALQADPEHIYNLNYLGMGYVATGKYREAERKFRKALSVDPSDTMSLENLGRLNFAQKQFDLAVHHYRAALNINPHLSNAYYGLGLVYEEQQNWDKAIESWTQALRQNNKHYDAMLNLAFAYLKHSDRENALKAFQRFERNAPRGLYKKELNTIRDFIVLMEERDDLWQH